MTHKTKVDLFPYIPYVDDEDNERFLKWKLENAQLLEKMSGFSHQRLFMECVELSFLSDDKQRRLEGLAAASKDYMQRAFDIVKQTMKPQPLDATASMPTIATPFSESTAPALEVFSNYFLKQKLILDEGRAKGSKSQKEAAAKRLDAIERMNRELLKHSDTARWPLEERADYICGRVMKNEKTRERYTPSSMVKMIQGKE